MKGIDLFCKSQSSTAIYHTMEEGSSSSMITTTTTHLGGRLIDRYNPIIRDERRSGGRASIRAAATPCSSKKPPINPKPNNQIQTEHHNKQKSRGKSNAKKQDDSVNIRSSGKQSPKQTEKQSREESGESWKSVHVSHYYQQSGSLWSSPAGSSRYLLSDEPVFDVVSDFDRVLTLVPVEHKISVEEEEADGIKQDEEVPASKPFPSSSSPPQSPSHSDQVVVLKVSLHCRACEGKVRKHISRMQGVTSFDIDFAAKKVTVVGNVTPLDVLASISKVKSAQLLTSGMPEASPSSSVGSDQMKTQKQGFEMGGNLCLNTWSAQSNGI